MKKYQPGNGHWAKITRLTGPAFTLLFVLGSLTTGCRLLRAPTKMVNAVVPVGRSSQPDPVDEQVQLQRYADDFIGQMSQALDDYAEHVGTDPARGQALRLKLIGGSSVISVVSGPNPSANLLDLVSVTVLMRHTVEDYWIQTTNGTAFRPWLEASRKLETNVWALASRFLNANQVAELQQAISQWYARMPEVHTTFFARPHEFASMVRTSQEGGEENSVFTLVNLDPTAGLDPAVREVTRTRLFAERAMFTMQRMPFLLRLQTELLAYELTEQGTVQLLLSNTAQLSQSANRVSRAAEGIGNAVTQLPDRFSAERKEILANLEVQQGKFQELVSGVDQALISGEKLSGSLAITVTNIDALMKRFGVGEPKTNPPAGVTNSVPFNILDYAKTADRADILVKNLNALVSSVGESTPGIQRASQQAGAELQQVIDHTFRLTLVLVLVSLAGAVTAALAYRILVQRLNRANDPKGR